jgi:formamidopyrimidine-DNA glycosylase
VPFTTTTRRPPKHDHVVLDMEGGARVTFNDARRFGAMDLMSTEPPVQRIRCWPAWGRSRWATAFMTIIWWPR